MKAIKQFIAEYLINTEIFEIAKSLSDYKNLVESYIPTLIAHIILIMKARQENYNEYVTHWKNEVGGFLRNCIGIRLKTKNTYDARYKHIYNLFINELELDTNDEYILSRIWNKCFEEGYDFDDKKIEEEFINIIHQFQEKYLDEIIDVIASNNLSKIQQFTNKL